MVELTSRHGCHESIKRQAESSSPPLQTISIGMQADAQDLPCQSEEENKKQEKKGRKKKKSQ